MERTPDPALVDSRDVGFIACYLHDGDVRATTAIGHSGPTGRFVEAGHGYAARMIALIVALLVVWLVLVVVGLAVKGLFWLFVIGAILFVVTAIVGFIRRVV